MDGSLRDLVLVPPKVDFHFSIPADGSGRGDWLPAVAVMWFAIWLSNLCVVLVRRDFDAVTRLTWVIVLVFVPFLGVPIYWFLAPERASRFDDSANQLAGTPWENNPGHTAKKRS